jgi:hypothetical protein
MGPARCRETSDIGPSNTTQYLRRTLRRLVLQIVVLHRLLSSFALLVVDVNAAVIQTPNLDSESNGDSCRKHLL